MRRLPLLLLVSLAACHPKPAVAPTVSHATPLTPSLVQPAPALAAAPVVPRVSAANCADQDEADALNMRVLQSDLMVGALSCRLNVEYGDFVKSQKASSANYANAMKKYFTRTGSGTAGMDRFVTSLANASSKQSLRAHETNFCGQAKELFKELRSLSSTQLAAKLNNTQDIVNRRGIPLCAQASADVNRSGPQPTTPISKALQK